MEPRASIRPAHSERASLRWREIALNAPLVAIAIAGLLLVLGPGQPRVERSSAASEVEATSLDAPAFVLTGEETGSALFLITYPESRVSEVRALVDADAAFRVLVSDPPRAATVVGVADEAAAEALAVAARTDFGQFIIPAHLKVIVLE